MVAEAGGAFAVSRGRAARVGQASGYPEHATEYGTHWNFFATMFGVEVFGDFCASRFASSPESRASVGACGALVAALASTLFVDAAYVLGEAPRDTFLSANREGLSSLAGYVAVFSQGSTSRCSKRLKHVREALSVSLLRVSPGVPRLSEGSPRAHTSQGSHLGVIISPRGLS